MVHVLQDREPFLMAELYVPINFPASRSRAANRIIRNIWVWPDSLTMCMGNPSWVFPVENALAGERIALISPTLVLACFPVLPGFAPAGEALLFRQKDPKPVTPRLAL